MSQESRGVKRKKKSFFQQSVKFHKKGIHGKGVRIDDESYEYFLNVLKLMNQEFGSEEDKKVFVENVFHQLEGNEVSYSSNQVVSRVIDNLLPLVSDSTLSHFMETFLENLRPLFMDQFASFVLQKLIITVTNRFLDKLSRDDNDPENIEENKNFVWLSIVSRYALNNLNEFVFSNYPNRVMRTVVCCLVGHTASSSKDDAVIISSPRIPKGLHKILKEFADELLQWPRFNELAYNTTSSGFLQILLQCMATFCSKRVKQFAKKILGETFTQKSQEVDKEDESSSQIPSVFHDVSANRLLEVVMRVAPAKLFTRIYTDYFNTRLPVLACHPTANFSVQKLIRFCAVKEQFEAIFDELSSGFEEILMSGKNGVILELCAGCLKHRTRQSVFIMTWMKCMACEDAQSLLAPSTIYLKKRNEYDSEEVFIVQLHGSLLLQNMLKFNKPIKVISSLLEMKSDVLCQVLCNPKGSHIANAMFESEFVGEKSKEKFFKALQGCYSTLAVSKHGSRVFDLVWQWASVKNKSFMAGELLDDEAKLSNSPFGRPIIYKVSLGSFRRNKEDWMKAQNQNNKVEKLFADIIE